jgi:phenylalanyl-tRNA synthetase beta subunit
LPPKSSGKVEIPKSFYYEWKIRELLVGKGFSEVMTSSFYEKGSVAIEKPLATDKSYARESLRGGFARALAMDTLNAPLFGTDEVKIFEIGRVFSSKSGKEETSALAIGCGGPKKKVAITLSEIVAYLSEQLGVEISGETKDGVFECELDKVFENLPEPSVWQIKIPQAQNEKFQTFSAYPFIVRDIAVFVPVGTDSEKVYSTILTEAGKFVVCSWLFDKFEKDGKISYAFRLVFQSSDRTLTDEEVNKIMEKIYSVMKGLGWEVR